jgi:hypothetical protein
MLKNFDFLTVASPLSFQRYRTNKCYQVEIHDSAQERLNLEESFVEVKYIIH